MRRCWLALVVPAVSLLSGCASTGAVPSPFPRPGPAPSARPVSPSPDAPAVVGTALSLRGIPYRNGGSDPSGFDCSGFVSYVFAQQGFWVPRTVTEQFATGIRVDPGSIEAGDLVFFTIARPGPSHVGIAISGGEFVHAPSSTGVVRVESLGAPYWASRFSGARRVR